MKNGTRRLSHPRYHRPLVTIWHHDPEVGGDDDSCGWFAPRSTTADQAWAESFTKREWDFWFSPQYGSINLRESDDLAVLVAAWQEVKEHLQKGGRFHPLKSWEINAILTLLSCPGDNFKHVIRDARKDGEGMERLLLLALRNYQRLRRPWYRHPKWHVRHWSFQFHDLQTFNRWAFSRCATCGKRFSWGYSPVAHGWRDDGGPKFLRGEKGVHHHECAGMGIGAADRIGSVTGG